VGIASGKKRVKRTPWAARESIAGVSTSGAPYAATKSLLTESTMRSRTFRRSPGSLEPDEHAPVPSRAAPAADAPAAPMKRRRVTPSLLNAGDIATRGSLAEHRLDSGVRR
jgi:hypothetical protein